MLRGGRWNALCRNRLEMFTSLYRVLDTCRYFAGASGGGGNKIHRRASHGAVQTGTDHCRWVWVRPSCHYAFFALISYSVRGSDSLIECTWVERWIDTICTALSNCFIIGLYSMHAVHRLPAHRNSFL